MGASGGKVKTPDDKETGIQHDKPEAALEKQGLLSGPPSLGARHSLVLWAFLGFANMFILRVDMSIALVAMAKQNSSATGSSSIISINQSVLHHDPCQNDPATDDDSSQQAEFDWSNTIQGFVLSAFYYGYFATQIPGGMLAKRMGGKKLFTIAMVGGSSLALLIPLAARTHVGFLIAVRVLQGAFQGVVFPSVQVLLSKWAPTKESSRLLAYAYAGCQVGTVVGILSAGYICDSPWGWPSVFYIEGVLGLVWCIGWIFFAFDSPASHPRITDLEKSYIESSIEGSQHKEPETPWCSILTSPALYAVAAAHFANDWGCFAVMTCMPKFMKDILRYDIKQNGMLTSLPYFVTWVCNMVAGTLADALRKRLRTVVVRKLMVCIGLICPASLLLTAAYLPGCSRAPVVVLLTVAMGFSGFTVAGHTVNHLDNAPVFAGLMYAITNTFGTTSGFIGPAVAGALTDISDTRHSWQTFFLISSAVYLAGGLIYVLLARAELQPWAKVEDTDTERIISPPSPQIPTYGSCSIQRDDEGDDEHDDVFHRDDASSDDDDDVNDDDSLNSAGSGSRRRLTSHSYEASIGEVHEER